MTGGGDAAVLVWADADDEWWKKKIPDAARRIPATTTTQTLRCRFPPGVGFEGRTAEFSTAGVFAGSGISVLLNFPDADPEAMA
jgi:hypothetical protein